MTIPRSTSRNIGAIFFDMGGTLRRRVPDEAFQREAVNHFMELLGVSEGQEPFLQQLETRHKAYARWAQETLIEASEQEIWTRWMVPELPRERVEPIAVELTTLWRNRHGRTVPQPDASKVIAALSARGYRLGVISNTISSVDVPRNLDEYGLTRFCSVVILSSISGRRKPDPEVFWQATRALRVDPSQCAYLGDRISRDVVGSKRAGFAVAIIIEPLGMPREDEKSATVQPDTIIHELSDLLDIFPGR